MRKLATLIIAASFSAPVLAADVTNFGIAIDEGHAFGHGAAGQSMISGGTQLSDRHVIDFGAGIDEGYNANCGEDGSGILLADEAGTGSGNVVDFGAGIDEGYDA